MSTLKVILNCAHRNLAGSCNNGNIFTRIPQNKNVPTIFIAIRSLSSFQISKHLELITNEKLNTKVSKFKLSVQQKKPMVVCMTWLMASRKNVLKYANIYLDQGFDVLNVSTAPWQVLWPTKGIQLVAKDLLEFLHSNENYTPLVIHGFSVGAYLWGEVLVRVSQEKERYQTVMDRICGQVWDSSVDVTEIHVGVPPSVFPKNKVLQNALQQYIMYHLKTFHKVATTHYIRASQMFHTDAVKAPALFFLSTSDKIGALNANSRARETWEANGIPVYWNCFDKSPHVGHYRYYPEIYKAELLAFLEKLSLISQPQKIQVKV